MIWHSHLFKNFPQFVVIHTVKAFHKVSEAEADFLFSIALFFLWSSIRWHLISGSPAFSKPSLYIWKVSVHMLLKSSLKDFEHDLASMCNEHNCTVVWVFFGIALLLDWNETHIFQSCGHCWVFQIWWHIECSTVTASSFRILTISAGIPSYPLALFRVVLPNVHLTSQSRMSGSRWHHHHGYLCH